MEADIPQSVEARHELLGMQLDQTLQAFGFAQRLDVDNCTISGVAPGGYFLNARYCDGVAVSAELSVPVVDTGDSIPVTQGYTFESVKGTWTVNELLVRARSTSSHVQPYKVRLSGHHVSQVDEVVSMAQIVAFEAHSSSKVIELLRTSSHDVERAIGSRLLRASTRITQRLIKRYGGSSYQG